MSAVKLNSILAHWGSFRLGPALEGGHRNRAYLVHGLDGDFVLKSTRRNEASTAWLKEVHQIAHSLGITVPTLQKGRNGLYCQKGWTLEAFIAGNHPQELPTSWLRSVMPQFHAAASKTSQRPMFASSFDLLAVETGGDINLDKMPPKLVEALRSAWSDLDAHPQCVVHGDLNPSNIVELPNGEFALLDWDESRVDFCFYDECRYSSVPANATILRAVQAYEIACSWWIEPAYAKRHAAAYLVEFP